MFFVHNSPHTKCSTFGLVPLDKEHLACFDVYPLKTEDLKCLEMKAPNSKAVSVVTRIIFTVTA